MPARERAAAFISLTVAMVQILLKRNGRQKRPILTAACLQGCLDRGLL